MRRSAYTLAWCFLTMLAIGALAAVSKRPFIFPSLGPSAIMLFAYPLGTNSAPRHVIVGHFIGAASGYVALACTGLLAVPFSMHIGPHRVLAAAIALGLTAGALSLAKTDHAPAGATTLIVALGILPRLVDCVFLMVAVVILTLIAFVVNRAFGIPYPFWTSAQERRERA